MQKHIYTDRFLALNQRLQELRDSNESVAKLEQQHVAMRAKYEKLTAAEEVLEAENKIV